MCVREKMAFYKHGGNKNEHLQQFLEANLKSLTIVARGGYITCTLKWSWVLTSIIITLLDGVMIAYKIGIC